MGELVVEVVGVEDAGLVAVWIFWPLVVVVGVEMFELKEVVENSEEETLGEMPAAVLVAGILVKRDFEEDLVGEVVEGALAEEVLVVEELVMVLVEEIFV